MVTMRTFIVGSWLWVCVVTLLPFQSASCFSQVVFDRDCRSSASSELIARDSNSLHRVDLRQSEQDIEIKIGEVRFGKSTDFEIELFNKTGKIIDLGSAKPSCGCTVARIVGSSSIGLWESVVLKFKVKMDETGDFKKTVFFSGKDSTLNLFVINVVGKCVDPIKWLLPSSIELDTTSFEAETSMELLR